MCAHKIEYYSNLFSYTSWIFKKIFASALRAGGGISPPGTFPLEPNCTSLVFSPPPPPRPKKLSTSLHNFEQFYKLQTTHPYVTSQHTLYSHVTSQHTLM